MNIIWEIKCFWVIIWWASIYFRGWIHAFLSNVCHLSVYYLINAFKANEEHAKSSGRHLKKSKILFMSDEMLTSAVFISGIITHCQLSKYLKVHRASRVENLDFMY